MFRISVKTSKHKNYSYTVKKSQVGPQVAWHWSLPTTLQVEVSAA